MACQRFNHMLLHYIHSRCSAAALCFSLFFMLNNSFGTKLKRKLWAFISGTCWHTFPFLRLLYLVINLSKSSLPDWLVHYIMVKSCLCHGEFLWTKCVWSIRIETETSCEFSAQWPKQEIEFLCIFHGPNSAAFTYIFVTVRTQWQFLQLDLDS
jgi:hypothetical protein